MANQVGEIIQRSSIMIKLAVWHSPEHLKFVLILNWDHLDNSSHLLRLEWIRLAQIRNHHILVYDVGETLLDPSLHIIKAVLRMQGKGHDVR